MTSHTWLEANNRYLAASLQWLRLKLRQLVPSAPEPAREREISLAPSPAPAPVERPPQRKMWFGLGDPQLAATATPPPTDPVPVPRAPQVRAAPAVDEQ